MLPYFVYETQRRQYEGHNTHSHLDFYTDQGPQGYGQYMMAKVSIVARVLPLRSFLFLFHK